VACESLHRLGHPRLEVAYSLLDDLDVDLQGVFLDWGFGRCGGSSPATSAKGASLPMAAISSEWGDDAGRHRGRAGGCGPSVLGEI
jgi:hypothetical protein